MKRKTYYCVFNPKGKEEWQSISLDTETCIESWEAFRENWEKSKSEGYTIQEVFITPVSK